MLIFSRNGIQIRIPHHKIGMCWKFQVHTAKRKATLIKACLWWPRAAIAFFCKIRFKFKKKKIKIKIKIKIKLKLKLKLKLN